VRYRGPGEQAIDHLIAARVDRLVVPDLGPEAHELRPFLIEKAVAIGGTRAADRGNTIEQDPAFIGAEREHVIRSVAVARLAAAARVGIAEAEDELLFESTLDQAVLAEEFIELR